MRRGHVCDIMAGAPALAARPGRGSVLAGALARPVRLVHCAGEPPAVALTCDDGPHPEPTPRVLDELVAAGARATSLVLVGAAEAHPAIVRRALAEGHGVGLHGADHAG